MRALSCGERVGGVLAGPESICCELAWVEVVLEVCAWRVICGESQNTSQVRATLDSKIKPPMRFVLPDRIAEALRWKKAAEMDGDCCFRLENIVDLQGTKCATSLK